MPPVPDNEQPAGSEPDYAFKSIRWAEMNFKYHLLTVPFRSQDDRLLHLIHRLQNGESSDASLPREFKDLSTKAKPAGRIKLDPMRAGALLNNLEEQNKLPGDDHTHRSVDEIPAVADLSAADIQATLDSRVQAAANFVSRVGSKVTLTATSPCRRLHNGSEGVVIGYGSGASEGFPVVCWKLGESQLGTLSFLFIPRPSHIPTYSSSYSSFSLATHAHTHTHTRTQLLL